MGCKWGRFVCAKCIRLCTCCNASLWLAGRFGGCWSTFPLLPPPVRLRALLAFCPSLCLPKCPQQWMRCFHAQEYLIRFPECCLPKQPQTAVLLECANKSDSPMLSCSWRSVSGDAKPARRKHLNMVSSRTLFQALLIHRMLSKTVTDFANSVLAIFVVSLLWPQQWWRHCGTSTWDKHLDPSKTHKTQTSSSTDLLVLLLTSHVTDRHIIDALFHDPFRYSKASVNFI